MGETCEPVVACTTRYSKAAFMASGQLIGRLTGCLMAQESVLALGGGSKAVAMACALNYPAPGAAPKSRSPAPEALMRY